MLYIQEIGVTFECPSRGLIFITLDTVKRNRNSDKPISVFICKNQNQVLLSPEMQFGQEICSESGFVDEVVVLRV